MAIEGTSWGHLGDTEGTPGDGFGGRFSSRGGPRCARSPQGIDLGTLRALNFTLMETDCAPGSRVPTDDCDFKENGVSPGGSRGGDTTPLGAWGHVG